MVTIAIETIGTERLVRSFNRIGVEVQDFTVPFTFVIKDFQELEKKIFNREGYPAKFAPLSPKYAAWKAQNSSSTKIMQLTRRLYKSLVTDSSNADSVRIIKKKYAARKTNVPYAHRHQMGTHGMPRREIVQVTETVKRRWGKIVQRWAMGLFEKYGIETYGDYVSSSKWVGL